ncbi:embryonic stem cell-specific 5-hydroxymethylcytosine-binding protein isoform X2 [Agrilus planipennis]|uniref:Abasic site processing protein HMCES n=1 Tax=Agrilus planipennis TaxID=224129 RepID=A0A1W4WGV2_AGRPL|nr:embryonic stem cell-specific 5-hydroxymethylcytosine-binding protein isoform X2 [Agrilus planipennis]
MCGRLACSLDPDCISKSCVYKKRDSKSSEEPKWIENSCYTYVPSYNISPAGTVCALADNSHFESETHTEYLLVPMRWGMIPIWSTDERKSQFHTHNARIETLMLSKIYKKEFMEGRRCIVVCEGYYEWQTTQKSSSHQPYFFYNEYTSKSSPKNRPSKPMVYLAGIFNAVRDVSGSNIRYTCSIITKDSDEAVSWCHHRMPLALNDFDDVEKWLDVSDEEPKEIYNFIKEYKSNENKSSIVLRYHAVDKQFVNNSKCEDKRCIERMSVKRKNSGTLDAWFKKKSEDK